MSITGGCYCGELRYQAEADIAVKVACCCRECQYLTGGGPNHVAGVAEESVSYTNGEPKQIKGKSGTPTREFCGNCGTHILTRSEGLNGMVMLKVGAFDDPAAYGGPDMVVYNCEAKDYHWVPEGMLAFDKFPE